MFFVLLNLVVDVHPDGARSAHQAGLSDGRSRARRIEHDRRRRAAGRASVESARLLGQRSAAACAATRSRMVCVAILLLIVVWRSSRPGSRLADPYQGSMIRRLRPIGTPGYPLGTDELGRDMLARLIYGGRLSLFMGITPVILRLLHRHRRSASSPAIVGGWVNTAIMRTIDVFYAFPSVLLAIAISGALGAGIVNAHRVAHHRLHPADRPRRRERHHPGAQPRLRRCGARLRRRRAHHHARRMCWATCWARSSSTRPA